jgi:hypothetical protein
MDFFCFLGRIHPMARPEAVGLLLTKKDSTMRKCKTQFLITAWRLSLV